jgi:hypothetical protein
MVRPFSIRVRLFQCTAEKGATITRERVEELMDDVVQINGSRLYERRMQTDYRVTNLPSYRWSPKSATSRSDRHTQGMQRRLRACRLLTGKHATCRRGVAAYATPLKFLQVVLHIEDAVMPLPWRRIWFHNTLYSAFYRSRLSARRRVVEAPLRSVVMVEPAQSGSSHSAMGGTRKGSSGSTSHRSDPGRSTPAPEPAGDVRRSIRDVVDRGIDHAHQRTDAKGRSVRPGSRARAREICRERPRWALDALEREARAGFQGSKPTCRASRSTASSPELRGSVLPAIGRLKAGVGNLMAAPSRPRAPRPSSERLIGRHRQAWVSNARAVHYSRSAHRAVTETFTPIPAVSSSHLL